MSSPITSFRERGVSASICENNRKDDSGTFLTATIENSFKDEDGAYQKSTSYTEQELTALATVALEARARIREDRLKKYPKSEADED
jgi:hypothetical protein